MRPVLPADLSLIDETEIRFMNESGRLKGMIGTFPSQALSGETPELPIH
jgi:hypothetical protein